MSLDTLAGEVSTHIHRVGPPAAGATRIVVIGCGFAGAYCAQELARLLRPKEAEIYLVDRHNYFVFYPLLIEAGTGVLEPRHSVVSIRAFLRRENFLMAEFTGLDAASREVECVQPRLGLRHRIAYDHLVIALGSITSLPNVPGLRRYGFPLKSLSEAVLLRDRAIEMLELAACCDDPQRRASLLHFVIVGANFTGVEMAGELEGLLHGALRAYDAVKPSDIRITLVERGPRILAAIDPTLSRYATDNLQRRGVNVRLNDSVTEIGPRHALLQSGEALSTETVIWTAGIAPPPIVRSLGLPLDDKGYILCERDLRVRGHDNIWAIGDAAVNIDSRGNAYPATAQHAVREGVACARNIARVLRGQESLPCDIRSRGSLAALGRRAGVAKVFGMRFSGFLGWWLWRTVYLLKMPGIGRKLRIVLEWNLELLSRRDYVQVGIHRDERMNAEPPAETPSAPRPGPKPLSHGAVP